MWGRADGDPYDNDNELPEIRPTRMRSRVGASLIIVALLGATARGGWLVFAGPSAPLNSPRPPSNRGSAADPVSVVSGGDAFEEGIGSTANERPIGVRLDPRLNEAMPSVPFAVRCLISHQSNDDPLLLPGQAGQSHRHSYFGNRTTKASSTVASLLSQATSCDDPADTAAYWMPTPIGAEWTAIRVYYGRGDLAPDAVSVYPTGFAMIGGNPPHRMAGIDRLPSEMPQTTGMDVHSKHPGGSPDGADVVGVVGVVGLADSDNHGGAAKTAGEPGQPAMWSCGRAIDEPGWLISIPPCPPGTTLAARIVFGQCAANMPKDGLTEVVFAQSGSCPATHPTGIAQLRIRAELNRKPTAFSSGPVSTLHADFWNTWDQQALTNLHNICIGGNRAADEIKRCGLAGTGPRVTGFG